MYERSPRYYGIMVYLLLIVSTGIFFAMDVSSNMVTSDLLQATAVAMPHQDKTGDIICSDYLLKVSEDGIRYVREAGGGTLFAASVYGNTGFYVLDRNHMIPARGSEVDQYTARRLEQALSECHGSYMRAGTYFDPFHHDKAVRQVARQDIAVMNKKPEGNAKVAEIAGENRPPATAQEQDDAENRLVASMNPDMVVAATPPPEADVRPEVDADTPETATTGNAELTGGHKAPEEPATVKYAEVGAIQDAHDAAKAEPRTDRVNRQIWNINIASLKDKANAERFIAHARDKGVETTRTHVTVNGNKYWRVSVKGFLSAEQAKAGSIRIKERLGLKEVWISRETEQTALRETAHKNTDPVAG